MDNQQRNFILCTNKINTVYGIRDVIYKKPFGMMRKYNRVHNIEDVQRL
jgi:hypothetical protein